MIRQFSSIAEMRDFALSDMSLETESRGHDSWYGETKTQTIERSLTGDQSLVPEAEKILDKLETQIETPKRIWERSVAGAFPIVPDYLSGIPTNMRRQREIGDEHSPIFIIASMNSSAGLSAKDLRNRGISILALALALSRIRPIQLYSLFLGDGRGGETVFTAQINTAPLDLATACYVLTSAGFYRRLGFKAAEKIGGFRGGWPVNMNLDETKREVYFKYLANKLSPNPERTLVIGPSYLRDKLILEPISWINAQIIRFTKEREDV